MTRADLRDEVPDDEADGACVEDASWLIGGEVLLHDFFVAVRDLLPPDAVLYLEGNEHHKHSEPEELLDSRAVPERLHIAFGTISPRPRVWHVPVTDLLLDDLQRLSADDDLLFVYHLHVYDSLGVLIWWHDAGANDIVISERFGEANTRLLSSRLSSQTSAVQQAHPADGQER